MKLCVTTVVDKEYMGYVPLFVYCVNRAYPQYHVRLFLRDPCPYAMTGLKYDFIPLFEDYPRYRYLTIALRFAIPKEYFKEFDYVYITDIDMMIMPEAKDIEYFHCMEMCDTGLCYSNSLRNANHYQGSQSLTGLHFASRVWFERTEEMVYRYQRYFKAGLLGLYREYDGVMLYRMAKDKGGGLPGKYRLTNRHHGIHCNNFKIFGANMIKLDSRIPMDFRVRWNQYLSDRVFRGYVEQAKASGEEAKLNLNMLEKLCRGELC